MTTINTGSNTVEGTAVVIGANSIKIDDITYSGVDWAQVSSVDINITAERRRAARTAAFLLIDKYQLTLLYSSLTADQQAELATYRQGWLDYPEAAEGTAEPIKPDWMV